jgi:predicted lipoprotein with Yx(FWY)xxD motif
VKYLSLPAGGALAIAAILAGCGSSTKSTSSSSAASSSTVASSSASSAPASPYGASAAGSSSSAKAAARPVALVTTKPSAKTGTILAEGSKKLTVYLFEGDTAAHSACLSACAQAWPPLLTGGAPKSVGGAAASDLGTITRPDGTHQVTYRGHPLYLFARDKDSGDAYGQGIKAFGASWYVLSARGQKVDKS